MPKTEEQLLRLKENRRTDIVVAALKVFCEKGYDGATINDIVKKAKCSHGLFYHYFNVLKICYKTVKSKILFCLNIQSINQLFVNYLIDFVLKNFL